MSLSNLELVIRDSGNNTSNWSILIRCKDGFIPNDKQMAVCSTNGTWLPDLEQLKCHNTAATIPSKLAIKSPH